MFHDQSIYTISKEMIELFSSYSDFKEKEMTIKMMIENILDIATKEDLWDNINPSFIICNEKFKNVFKTSVLHLGDILFLLKNNLEEKSTDQAGNEEFLFIFKDKHVEEILLKENIEERGIYLISQLIELIENYAWSKKLALEENKEIIDVKDDVLGVETNTNFLHHNQIYSFLEEISVPFLPAF